MGYTTVQTRRLNMVLDESEVHRLDFVKSVLGLKKNTDTIRHLIASTYLELKTKAMYEGKLCKQ